jgi:hypothetical protein
MHLLLNGTRNSACAVNGGRLGAGVEGLFAACLVLARGTLNTLHTFPPSTTTTRESHICPCRITYKYPVPIIMKRAARACIYFAAHVKSQFFYLSPPPTRFSPEFAPLTPSSEAKLFLITRCQICSSYAHSGRLPPERAQMSRGATRPRPQLSFFPSTPPHQIPRTARQLTLTSSGPLYPLLPNPRKRAPLACSTTLTA